MFRRLPPSGIPAPARVLMVDNPSCCGPLGCEFQSPAPDLVPHFAILAHGGLGSPARRP